jgi:hypothetical protein
MLSIYGKGFAGKRGAEFIKQFTWDFQLALSPSLL